jgi:hypothetical protein
MTPVRASKPVLGSVRPAADDAALLAPDPLPPKSHLNSSVVPGGRTAAKRTGLPAITDVGPVTRSGARAGGGWTGWGAPPADDAGAPDGADGAPGVACGVEGPPAADVVGAAAGSVGAAACAALPAPSSASAAANWIASTLAIEPLGRDRRSGFPLNLGLAGSYPDRV